MKKMIGFMVILLFFGMLAYYFYPEEKLAADVQIDSLVVLKSKRVLLAYSNSKLLKSYNIALSRQPLGAKEIEGDQKTPEGRYFINDKNPNSAYHKNLGISYPNKADAERAKRLGKPAGGAIKIHGLRNKMGFIGKFHRLTNWTLGCIAVTNPEIDELYRAVKVGTPIQIKP